MFKLAHISDVHLGPMPRVNPLQLMNKRITGYLNWKLNRRKAMTDGVLEHLIEHMKAGAPDHILVSGDLVNLVLPDEISRMRKWLDALGDPYDVSVTLGNHDTYVAGAGRKCQLAWSPFLMGDQAKEPSFPYLRIRDVVAIVSCNSGRASLPFYATGYFGKKQAKETKALIEEAQAAGKFVVVMIHHPPFPNATVREKRLIGDKRFCAMIAECGADLVLHGHTHIVSFEWIDGLHHKVPVIGVPSASHAAPALGDPATGIIKHNKPGARYNLFSIEKNENGWQCEHEEWGYADGSRDIALLAQRSIYKDDSPIVGD